MFGVHVVVSLFECNCCLQAEELGCEGKVEEAQGVMKLCDQLREERRQLENVSKLFSFDALFVQVCKHLIHVMSL